MDKIIFLNNDGTPRVQAPDEQNNQRELSADERTEQQYEAIKKYSMQPLSDEDKKQFDIGVAAIKEFNEKKSEKTHMINSELERQKEFIKDKFKYVSDFEGFIKWYELKFGDKPVLVYFKDFISLTDDQIMLLIFQYGSEKSKKRDELFKLFESGTPSPPQATTKKIKIKERDIAKEIETALNHISIFSGINPLKTKVMADTDYKKLCEYTSYLIEFEKPPDETEPIKQINVSNEFIRYTFYQLHKELYTTKGIRTYFIDFLHTVFTQFQNTDWETTKTKFSTPPTNYNNDIKKMTK